MGFMGEERERFTMLTYFFLGLGTYMLIDSIAVLSIMRMSNMNERALAVSPTRIQRLAMGEFVLGLVFILGVMMKLGL
jgi:hypothetical protein